MGRRVEVEDPDHLESLLADGSVIVDFYADWCGPCVTMDVFFEEVIDDVDATVAAVDTEVHDILVDRYDVRTQPTLLFYRDGNLVERHAGLPHREAFHEMVDEYVG